MDPSKSYILEIKRKGRQILVAIDGHKAMKVRLPKEIDEFDSLHFTSTEDSTSIHSMVIQAKLALPKSEDDGKEKPKSG